MRRAAALILAAMLTACAGQAVKIDPAPTIVRVPVDRYIAVPADLTARMDPGRPATQDYQEAKALALRRLDIIMAGNCRFLRIAALAQPLSAGESAEWRANECAGDAPAADTGATKP